MGHLVVEEGTLTDKELGRYYTPDDVAEILVAWALDGRTGRLLDPSFGGCSFLRSGLLRLHDLAGTGSARLVFGVDIDPSADSFAGGLIRSEVPRENLIIGDFLDLNPSDLPAGFRCVVGNPPYVRHHALEATYKSRLVETARELGCLMPATANLWAHFVFASTRYLESDGRLAFLVPTSGLRSDYAIPLLEYLTKSAVRVTLIPIQDRLFEGTTERVTALLVEGWARGPGDVMVADELSRDELRNLLIRQGGLLDVSSMKAESDSWSFVEAIADRIGWRDLSEFADIRIGTVTGSNQFFLRRPSEVRELGLMSRTAIASGRQMKGIRWTHSDVRDLLEGDGRSQLLDLSGHATESCPDPSMRSVLLEGQAAGVPTRAHSMRRPRWWVVEDMVAPDAMFHYMTGGTPRVVLNEAKSLCTNSIHRLFWKEGAYDRSAIAASSCTSLFELECEVTGRTFSGGLLKLEPSDAKLLKVTASGPRLDDRLDRLLKAGDHRGARLLADQKLLLEKGVTAEELKHIRRLVGIYRDRRAGRAGTAKGV